MTIFRLELEKTIVTLDFTTFNLTKCNISCKKKSLFKFRTKFVLFGLELKKLLYCDILQQHPQIFSNTKFRPKIKILKFGTKTALIGYFGLEFQKTNIVFEINILEFVNMQPSIQKQKNLNLGPKIPYLGIFWLQFNKNYHQIFNRYSRICETIKFRPKQKKSIGPEMLYQVFGLE